MIKIQSNWFFKIKSDLILKSVFKEGKRGEFHFKRWIVNFQLDDWVSPLVIKRRSSVCANWYRNYQVKNLKTSKIGIRQSNIKL